MKLSNWTMTRRAWLALSALVAMMFSAGLTGEPALEPIKVGIIGLDAHAVPWTTILHSVAATNPISSLHIVAAVAAPSTDIPFSIDNNERNVAAMRQLGVEVLDSIEELVKRVDAVMLLSIDGRPHLEQAKPVFAAKKPLFVDKPAAASLAEIVQLFRSARESGTPLFSNSSLRYGPATVSLKNQPRLGRVLGCDTYCSGKSILPGHPDRSITAFTAVTCCSASWGRAAKR